MMWLLAYSTVAICFLCAVPPGQGAIISLTMPKNPHYDIDYTITASAFGIPKGKSESISLEYRGLMDKSKVINSTILRFFADGMKTWAVVFPWTRMEKLQETSMTLAVETFFGLEERNLFFSRSTGYIFIQTDKPLYTPRQTVKFRIIAVDEYQRLPKYPIKVDIKNEKLIVVDRMRYSAEDAFKGQEFELPKETPPGNWTISANFEGVDNSESSIQTVSFEVREYVLPRFSASIDINQDVITKSTSWITVTVSAKYVHGRTVLGSVEMQLGIWDPKAGVTLLPEKYTGNMTRGKFKIHIRVSKLIPQKFIVRENKRLYINANVTEEGTMENDTIVDTSTFIAHPYYDISFAFSKTHFKPGFPYTLHTQVRARSGRPASWLKLWVDLIYYDKNAREIGGNEDSANLDASGSSVQDFNIPSTATRIVFKTTVLDFKAGTNNDNTWEVPVLHSPNKQYMHVSLAKPIKKTSDGLVKLRYTPGNKKTKERITVTVLARGQILFSKSVDRTADGQSMVPIPNNLYTEVSPNMRIVASFYYPGGANPEFVVDSLQVDTDAVCVEELSLSRPFFSSPLKKPKEKFGLVVSGHASMNVGLVAVDKAVFLLNDAHTLTRDSLFQQFASHDQGKGNGDGSSIEEVMENSGLLHFYVDTVEEPTPKGQVSRVAEHLPQGIQFLVAGLSLEHLTGKSARKAGNGGLQKIPSLFPEAPPQTVRKYFPESWLFDEIVLPKSGRKKMDLTLPDSITTWSFMAVGLSSNRGVCVSNRLEQKVQKNFFVDVRMPYKVKRLEEVKVRVAVYNYRNVPIRIALVVSGSGGLCFAANRARGSSLDRTRFAMKINTKGTRSREIKVIPLKNGDLTLRVDAVSVNERDTVEKQLYVVAEGLRLRKSLTFVLDPEAKYTSHVIKSKSKDKDILVDTKTFKNAINLKQKTQKTTIDLAMPTEVIRGSENCKISAFGDLMGDIINHAVVKSKSLMDYTVHNAEEVLGELGPSVHALLYANTSGLMDADLRERARKFVVHGVARLLGYRKNTAFALTPKSQEATWLTTAVLKTLCHSSSLAFIDKQFLIDDGFEWLLRQVTVNKTLIERDWRLAKNSSDYQVMLTAEVVIAVQECGITKRVVQFMVKEMVSFLEENMDVIEDPMVLAKLVYALTLYDPSSANTTQAVKQLKSVRKKNQQGQVYWSNEMATSEDEKVPFWYQKGMKASAIEATAFSLLAFLRVPLVDVNAVAEWLVSQRNHHGSFISALDSMAAIQALSSYSQRKTGLKRDLFCNVTSDRARKFSHSFKFTEKNAIRPESFNNVPVGHTLEVLTKGQGLGQMQVNVEYNIPIDPNEKCPFNVTIEIKSTEVNFYTDMIDDPLCQTCSWGCRLKVVENATDGNNTAENGTATNTTDVDGFSTTESPAKANPSKIILGYNEKRPPHRSQGRLGASVRKPIGKKRKTPFRKVSLKKGSKKSSRYVARRKIRKPRSVGRSHAASRRSICVKVCLKHIDVGEAGFTRVEVEMLTGYLPVTSDIERLKEYADVQDAWYVPSPDSVIIIFQQVSDEDENCIAFRAVNIEGVGRPTPATVVVTEVGNPAPSCALEYHPPSNEESLQVYCANFAHLNRGECRCYSGLCSSCAPMSHSEKVDYAKAKDLVCRSDLAYQLQVSKVYDRNQWVEIDAKVLSVNKTGSHKVQPNQMIKMVSPASCMCPTNFGQGAEKLYLMSVDVEKMVDRRGNTVHRYLLDEQSAFLRVTLPNGTLPSLPTGSLKSHYNRGYVPHVFLQQAFKNCSP